MKKHVLKAKDRHIHGHKVKILRKTGEIPGTVYGKNVKSIAVAVNGEEFVTLYKEVGESSLVELTIDNAVRPVLIHNVQKHPVSQNILHVEFFQVDLKEKVHTNVPIHTSGEAVAVKDKVGVLLIILDEVEVEALPANLPEHMTLDVSELTAVEQELKVKDIKNVTGVTILTDSDLTVVKIAPLVTKEAQVQAQEEATQAASQAQQDSTAPEATSSQEIQDTTKSSSETSE